MTVTYSSYFFSESSDSPMPPSSTSNLHSLWTRDLIPDFLVQTDPFYQTLLEPSHHYQCFPLDTIARDIIDGNLLACSDGSYDDTPGTGTFGWVMATKDHHVRFRGAGPVDCHPNFNSSYWAKLSGLLAFLYIIQHKCTYYPVSTGSPIIYCDNKSAIRNIFQKNQPGITPCLAADYDIIC
jgi:hypothetical protein